jgi:hypothetical protein
MQESQGAHTTGASWDFLETNVGTQPAAYACSMCTSSLLKGLRQFLIKAFQGENSKRQRKYEDH